MAGADPLRALAGGPGVYDLAGHVQYVYDAIQGHACDYAGYRELDGGGVDGRRGLASPQPTHRLDLVSDGVGVRSAVLVFIFARRWVCIHQGERVLGE